MKAFEILNELRANKTQFDSILADPSAKMGFECEMILNAEKGSGDYDTPTVDPDSLRWRQVERYLDISSRQQSRIDDEFSEWLSDKVYEDWRDNKQDYIRDYCKDNGLFADSDEGADEDESEEDREARHEQVMEDNEDAARDDWEENTRDSIESNYDMDDFIDDVYGSNSRFIRDFGLNAEYGFDDDGEIYTEYHDENSGGSKEAHEEAAASLRRKLKLSHIEVSDDYHSASKEEDSWYIEPDSSITDDDGGVPAEIVSKVYSVGEGLKKLEELFDWMDDNEHRTDRSTGIHINLSISGKEVEDYDFLKMMIFFDENHTANLFGRLENTYAVQMRDRLLKSISNKRGYFRDNQLNIKDVITSNNLNEVLDVLKSIGRSLESTFGKYASIRNRGNGVFEFRGMGGSDYQTKYDTIRKQTVHMAYILKIGSDEKALAKEYITKVFALINQGKFSDPNPGSGAVASVNSKEFSAFKNLFSQESYWLKQSAVKPMDFVSFVADRVAENKMQLDRMQIMQIKRAIYKSKMKPDTMREFLDKNVGDVDSVYNTIARWMNWPFSVPVDDSRQTTMPFVRQGSPSGVKASKKDNEPNPLPSRYYTESVMLKRYLRRYV